MSRPAQRCRTAKIFSCRVTVTSFLIKNAHLPFAARKNTVFVTPDFDAFLAKAFSRLGTLG